MTFLVVQLFCRNEFFLITVGTRFIRFSSKKKKKNVSPKPARILKAFFVRTTVVGVNVTNITNVERINMVFFFCYRRKL